jgi:hypothetical protein
LTKSDCTSMLSDMATNRRQLVGEIARLQKAIASLGPLRPGSLYSRYNVCGRPGCRCGRAKNPVKHGPYHYLSYTFQGKSHTEFVSEKDLPKVQEQVRNYSKLRELLERLVACNIAVARLPKEPQ